jgi:hypothetical protein
MIHHYIILKAYTFYPFIIISNISKEKSSNYTKLNSPENLLEYIATEEQQKKIAKNIEFPSLRKILMANFSLRLVLI